MVYLNKNKVNNLQLGSWDHEDILSTSRVTLVKHPGYPWLGEQTVSAVVQWPRP